MGKTPILWDIPEWGATIWVHDTSSRKLSVHMNEGQWVGYDLNSDRHRVYWKGRCTVTVECNAVFSEPDLQYDGPFDKGITNEPEGENNRENISLNHEQDEEPPTIGNEVIHNPENTTMPKVCCSECHKQPSHYVRDLLSGEFTTRSKNKKFPTGLQVPKIEEEISAVAMLTRMSEACGLEPRTLNKAKKSLDWPRCYNTVRTPNVGQARLFSFLPT